MNKHFWTALVCMGLLLACNQQTPSDSAALLQPTSIAEGETETIGVPIEQHSVQLTQTGSQKTTSELQQWWDSLPKPLQSQIKAKEVGVQLISSVRTSPEDAKQADMQIAETTKELERIIGAPADMSVSTTVLEQPVADLAETTTSIQLLKKVPVKLSEFSTQIFLRKGEVTYENIQSMQYWWLSLPQELQDKIKRREIEIEVACYTVDKGDLDIQAPRYLADNAEQHAMVLADALNELIGSYSAGSKRLPLAKIDTKAFIEKSNNKNFNYPAPQYIMLQLHAQRETISMQPSM